MCLFSIEQNDHFQLLLIGTENELPQNDLTCCEGVEGYFKIN